MTKAIETLAGADLAAFRAVLQPHVNALISPTLVADASAAAAAAQISVPFATWAALAAAAGMAAGTKASVVATDTGTHTDPIVGGTVSNAGVYEYKTAPAAGWQRTANLDSADAAANAATAGGAAAAAVTANTNAQAALAAVVAAVAGGNIYNTRAALDAALGGLAANAYARVIQDEAQGNRTTLYQKQSGAAVLVWKDTSARYWYVDPRAGADTNAGAALTSAFATVEKAMSMATPGDTIWLQSGAEIKYADNVDYTTWSTMIVPEGVSVRSLGSRAEFNAFDKLTGAWTVATGTSYYKDYVAKFGGNGALGGAARLYPAAIYRAASGFEWQQVKWYYVSDFASEAAGKTFVDANIGTGIMIDQSGYGGSVFAGWRKGGTIRAYVNLGTDPSAYAWLVAQRATPLFLFDHFLENITFFGGIQHDGLVCRGSVMNNIEIAYPANHGCEITGTSTRNLTIRDGKLLTRGGYCMHHFGESQYWAKQRIATHRGTRIYNWNGAILGLHGTNSVDGGGGPGIVTAGIIFEDGLFQNVLDIAGVAGAINIGVEFNNCRAFGYSSMSAWGCDVLYRGCHLVAGGLRKEDNSGTGNGYAVSSPIANCTVTILDSKVVGAIQGGTGSGAGGKIIVKRSRVVTPGLTALITHVADHQGIMLDMVAAQCRPAHPGRSVAPFSNTTAGRPITVSNSHLGGWSDGRGLTGVTTDEHTIYGGDAGLSFSGNIEDPIDTDRYSTWHGLGERLLNGGGYVQRAIVWASSRAVYTAQMSWSEPFGQTSTAWSWPAGFTPRGVCGSASTTTKLYAYGLAGKVYKTAATAAAFAAVNMGGLTNNFVAHFLDGANLFLLGDDGSITKIDTATDTVTQVAAAGAVASYPLRGGLVVSSGGNLLVYGGNAAYSAGGVLYSTDGGATWAVNATSGIPKWFYAAALVNGVICLAGTSGYFWTATTVGGIFVARTIKGLLAYNVTALLADTTMNSLGLLLKGGGSAGTNAVDLTASARSAMGYIDASNADPATWKVKLRKTPVPLSALYLNAVEFGVGQVGRSIIGVSQNGRIAALSELMDGDDWMIGNPSLSPGVQTASMDDGLRTIFDKQSFRIRDELGYLGA